MLRPHCWALAVMASALALCVSAAAHDSWISRGQLKNPAGEWCCGDGDCGVFVSGRIVAVAGGYEVDADFAIQHVDQPPTIERVKEFWSYADVMPSPDGQFWRCKRPDGSPRCKFAPPPNT